MFGFSEFSDAVLKEYDKARAGSRALVQDVFEAFHTTGPPDFPSVEVATVAARMLLSHPGFYSVLENTDY